MFISRLVLSACMLAFVFICSCSKDESTTGTNTFTSGMVAVVDGTTWTGTTPVALMTNGMLTIQSFQNGENLQIGMLSVPSVGTFTLGGNSTTTGTITNTASQKVWSTTLSGSGTLTISKLTSTEIEGTFSFTAPPYLGNTATNTREVKEGKFALKFL